jgi:Zn finger protein HypA/HybF involved in hydrogenase expression
MSENPYASRDLLVRGIAAVKAGEKKEGRFFLEWYLSQNPPLSERNDALFYLYQIAEGEAEKRTFLEEILTQDPLEIRARREMAILNGEIQPADLVNPDRLARQQPEEVRNSKSERFVCPKCGGRLTFSADGQTLICEQCEVQSRLRKNKGEVKDENFILALAGAKGHSQAVNTQVVSCQGCGAEFIVPPRNLSWCCPFCDSAYAIQQLEERQIISPNSLIPFYVPEKEARGILRDWIANTDPPENAKLCSLTGMYLPVWTFDVGGVITWQFEVRENKKWVTRKDQKSLFLEDICVSASQKWPEWNADLLASYDLKQLRPFDPEYLASWMAETYEIQAGDAALLAREIALKREKTLIQTYTLQPVREEQFNSTRMTVEQYKLILVPLWSGILQIGQRQVPALINGQNGRMITPRAEEKGFSAWLDKFFFGDPEG